jgi:hypothetical protein
MIPLGRTVRQRFADVDFIPTYLRSGPLIFTQFAADWSSVHLRAGGFKHLCIPLGGAAIRKMRLRIDNFACCLRQAPAVKGVTLTNMDAVPLLRISWQSSCLKW